MTTTAIEQTPGDFLAEMFEYEWCGECGRGDAGHTAVLLDFGAYGANYFARCDHEPRIVAGEMIYGDDAS